MAKMTVEFDTESKTFSAAIDGKPFDNAIAAEIRPSWEDEGKFVCNFVARATDKDSGITELRQLYAAATPAAKAALESGGSASKDYPGFVESRVTEKTKAQSDIEAFFTKK